MTQFNYERLTALDNSFLLLERPNAYMHVASVCIHDAAPLQSEDGGVDIQRIRKGVAGVLHRIPRYRQKLAWIPLAGTPVWVDDAEFRIEYHIRHTALPRPGETIQLKRLAARVMAQRLDRARPLWEIWIVEGLADGRFAVISKTHHCMIDGVSGVDLMNVIMSPEPDAPVAEAPPFVPRRAPTDFELARDEALRQLRMPAQALRGLGALSQVAAREAGAARREILSRLRSAALTLGTGLRRVSATPFNRPIGPHRRFDWTTHPLAEIKAIRRALGGSLNDVVLAIVAGAVRRFLEYRRVDVRGLKFRVLAPVSVRDESESGALGNRVSAWFVPLPISEAAPAARLRAIAEVTEGLKAQRSAVGAQLLTQAAEWTPATLLSLGARNATRLQPFNFVVTNVPGPQLPLYLLGARMRETYPLVPLVDGSGFGIALFSYDGRLHWGFNADYELMPDLKRMVAFVDDAFAELCKAAAKASVAAAAPAKKPRAKKSAARKKAARKKKSQ